MSELIKKYKYRNTLIVMIYFILFIFLQKTHNLYLLSIYFFIATGILYKYLCSLGTISRNSIRLFSVMLFFGSKSLLLLKNIKTCDILYISLK